MTKQKHILRNGFKLESMVQKNATIIVADPSISSSNCALPMIEFVNDELVPRKNKVEVRKDSIKSHFETMDSK